MKNNKLNPNPKTWVFWSLSQCDDIFHVRVQKSIFKNANQT